MQEINCGIYCFDADLFWKHIDEIQPTIRRTNTISPTWPRFCHPRRPRVQPTFTSRISELLGINNRVELAAVDRIFRERKVRELMLDGVTIEKPETVPSIRRFTIGMDTVIEPFAQISGNTVIGDDCHIGACSIVQDSNLGDDVEIVPFTIVANSRLESNAHAGPFARLRMENHVEPRARTSGISSS